MKRRKIEDSAWNLLQALSDPYPCKTCREHYTEYIKTHKPTVRTKAGHPHWLYDLHECVKETKKGLQH